MRLDLSKKLSFDFKLMKLHSAKLIAVFFGISVVAGHSQTLNWSSLTGSDIVDSSGSPLDNSFVIELGTFDPTFSPDDTNIDVWGNHWRVFDVADYSYNPTNGGYFTGTRDVQDVANYASMFAGLTAYIWIYNDTKSEHFLASSTTKPGVAEWEFPLLDPGCCPNGEVTTWSVSNFQNDDPIWGSQGNNHGGGEYSAPGPFDIQTHVVPEPASTLLAVLGLSFALIHRRRD